MWLLRKSNGQDRIGVKKMRSCFTAIDGGDDGAARQT
jgi:hypothetical protein